MRLQFYGNVKKRSAEWSRPVMVALFLLLAMPAFGDQVILYDGKVIDGKVISESATLVTMEVDTIRISLLRKDVKEIKYGDQLFDSLEQDTTPDKPTTDTSVLPALRETAKAEEPTETPTEVPELPTAVPATATPTDSPLPEPTQVAQEPAQEEPEPTEAPEEIAQTEPDAEPTTDTETEYPVPEVDPAKLPAGKAYIITYDYANIRKGPSTGDEKVAKLDKGTILIVDEKADNGWVHFKTLEGDVTGWVHGNLVETLADTPVVVSYEYVNFRRGPGTAQVKLGQLDYGDVARVLEEKSPWYRLRLADGRTGWAHSEYLTKVPMAE